MSVNPDVSHYPDSPQVIQMPKEVGSQVNRSELMRTIDSVELCRQELARRHLLDFIMYTDPSYDVGDHHRMIAKQLEATLEDIVAVRNGTIDPNDSDNLRVMIYAPPRHGKSRMISREFVTWASLKYPWLSAMLTSYSAELALEFGRMTRNHAQENAWLFDVKLSNDAQRADRWTIDGWDDRGVVAAGVGGSINGKGAHLAVVDDPYKNYKEASSSTVRKTVYDWYLTTLRTRLAPGGAVIIVQTRWHEQDLPGKLISDIEIGADKWKVLNFSAISEGEGDILGRPKGRALWPGHYDEKYLEMTKVSMGSFMFNAMYQGKPTPPEGTMFKRKDFRYWEIETIDGAKYYRLHRSIDEVDTYTPDQCWHFQTCDPTSSAKNTADYFVCSTWIVTPSNDLLLYDVMRTQMEGAEQPTLIINCYNKHRPAIVGIETNGVGNTTYQMIRNAGVPVKDIKATTDKVTKAIPFGARYESNKVFHLMGAQWLGDWEDELASFPNGNHDDQVDTGSYATAILIEQSVINGDAIVSMDIQSRISPI